MRERTCKHYRGCMDGCAVGVKLADVTPRHGETGWGLRIPCVRDYGPRSTLKIDTANQGTCDKYEEPTAAELAEEDAAIEAAMQRHLRVGPVVRQVKQERKGTNWRGVVDCPACGGTQTLHLSHAAYNGHVHGRCETDGCVAWME